MKCAWNPNLYNDKHDFVYKYGEELVTLLDPQEGELILDLGCGTGELTKTIADSAATVVGIDNSLAMIETARHKYQDISFHHMDATDFDLDMVFDAVFSSSVLHWITEPEAVMQNLNRHLKPGGRFVAEFGGKGCVNKILTAITQTLDDNNATYPPLEDSLYYPSISQYTQVLESHGFEVRLAMLFERPTRLQGEADGLKNFIAMFFNWLFANVETERKAQYIAQVEEKLKSELLRDSTWVADYMRIRILAVKVNDC